MENPVWFHCNNCWSNPGVQSCWSNPGVQSCYGYVITECMHILCERCSKEVKLGECPVCRQKCSMVALTSETPAKLRKAFEDPKELADELTQVIQFQHSSTERYIVYLKDLVKQQLEVIQQAKTELLALKELQSEVERLKKENAVLQQRQATSSAPPASATVVPPCAVKTPLALATAHKPGLFDHFKLAPQASSTSLFPAAVPSASRTHVPGTPKGPERLLLKTPPQTNRSNGREERENLEPRRDSAKPAWSISSAHKSTPKTRFDRSIDKPTNTSTRFVLDNNLNITTPRRQEADKQRRYPFDEYAAHQQPRSASPSIFPSTPSFLIDGVSSRSTRTSNQNQIRQR